MEDLLAVLRGGCCNIDTTPTALVDVMHYTDDAFGFCRDKIWYGFIIEASCMAALRDAIQSQKPFCHVIDSINGGYIARYGGRIVMPVGRLILDLREDTLLESLNTAFLG